MKFLNELCPENFLQDYWEKKPLVFRGVVSDPKALIEKDDLIEMASDEFYESRLIKKTKEKWDVQDGPFDKKELKKIDDPILSEERTLINHNLELYLPEIKNLVENLSFLPKWLFDDAMTTYSTKGSSVGAHIDNYNVFILQLNGSRTWRLEMNPKKGFIEDLDVKILKEFNHDTEYQLNPGDMIYIPPHVAHHGISNEQSLSISLGYKSLEDKKILEQFCMYQFQRFQSEDFYKTSFNEVAKSPTLIPQSIIEDLKQKLITNISKPEMFRDFLLSFTSAPKRTTDTIEFDWEEFLQLFESNPLFKDEYARFSCIKDGFNNYKFGINEFIFEATKDQAELINRISLLSNQEEISYQEFEPIKEILFELTSLGITFFELE